MKISVFLLVFSCFVCTKVLSKKENVDDDSLIVEVEEGNKSDVQPTASDVKESSENLLREKHDSESNANEDNISNVQDEHDINGSGNNAENFKQPHSRKEEEPSGTSEKSEELDEDGYKVGSVCVYCKYCKLCKHCDKCPCKNAEQHKECSMCKYCQYCGLCGTVCETVCTPGSFLDMFSSAVYDALPTFSEKTRQDMNADLEKARDFIKEYL